MRESARKGFVTVATGNTMYYIMARNLLLSYRHFAKDPLPFAIICDRTNRYTDCFDDVILLPDPSRSYNDKLRLPSLAPYDHTIFVDADCLAYRDLNDMWEMFEGAPAFGVLGRQLPLDSEKRLVQEKRYRRVFGQDQVLHYSPWRSLLYRPEWSRLI